MDTHLLVISPDESACEEISSRLAEQGYTVDKATSQGEGLRKLHAVLPPLIIIDVSKTTPELDGFRLSRKIRAVSDIPLIWLSTSPNYVEQVEKLKIDACLIYPFSQEELVSKVRLALTKRSGAASMRRKAFYVKLDGDFFLNFDTRQIQVRGRAIDLTPKEFKLLVCLVQHPNQFVPYDKLLEAIWDSKKSSRTALKAYIWRLRQKIEEDPENPRYILTQRGLGYIFKCQG
ncbi:MAG: response regulator transcription factor [Anaerolineae bacterium]